MTKHFRVAWLRRDSILFLDEKTGARFEYFIPGQAIPGVPAYLRLANGTGKSGFVLTSVQLLEGLHLRRELVKYPWCIVLPNDLQNHEEAMLIDFGIRALGAKQVFLVPFPAVIGPSTPSKYKDIVSIADTFRSVTITYFDLEGKHSHIFLPYEELDEKSLNRALDQLCPSRRPTVYVDDLDGSGRWNHLGTPVSMEEALAHLGTALSRIK